MASADDYVDYTDFPNNVVLALSNGLKTLPSMNVDHVFMRPLRATDPGACVGVVCVDWRPIEYEIGQVTTPLGIMAYNFSLQAMIKHSDQVLGLVAHARLSKLVRRMVDSDPAVRLSLLQLSVDDSGTRERSLKLEITRQQFLANEIRNSFVYISALQMTLQTETVAIL